jgi:cytochrome c556
MKRTIVAIVGALLTACGSSGPASTTVQSPAGAPAADPSWTGLTRPHDLIVARQELMAHIEELMEPIDLLAVDKQVPTEELQQHAEVIGAMLAALPHLFPPTTNLYDPTSPPEKLATLALPAIWQNFDNFYKLAGEASAAAEVMAKAEGKEAQRDAGAKLRAACDACHAGHELPFHPSNPLPSDYEFDFDSVLKP